MDDAGKLLQDILIRSTKSAVTNAASTASSTIVTNTIQGKALNEDLGLKTFISAASGAVVGGIRSFFDAFEVVKC